MPRETQTKRLSQQKRNSEVIPIFNKKLDFQLNS